MILIQYGFDLNVIVRGETTTKKQIQYFIHIILSYHVLLYVILWFTKTPLSSNQQKTIITTSQSRNQCKRTPPHRIVILDGRKQWENGSGRGTNVMFVSRDVSSQSHRHSDADPWTGPSAISSILGAEGAGAGGKPVLQQVPEQDREAAQVSRLT